jgi:hypothetical protein
VKIFSTKEPPVIEVRADRKAKGQRERVVAELEAIPAFDFATEGQALVITCAVPRDSLALERGGGAAAAWIEVPLGEEVLGKKKKEEADKKKGKKEKDDEEEGDDDEQKIAVELRIEGDATKREKVKDAFLVALSKAKEAAVKGTHTPHTHTHGVLMLIAHGIDATQRSTLKGDPMTRMTMTTMKMMTKTR